jgi:hypothetical protein
MGARRMSTSQHQRGGESSSVEAQSLFRKINERVKDLNVSFGLVAPAGEWICECANKTCIEKVAMWLAEYEAIRRYGARFLILPSDEHVWPDVERVIERHKGYWVVEKLGLAADLANRADPRSTGPLPLRT